MSINTIIIGLAAAVAGIILGFVFRKLVIENICLLGIQIVWYSIERERCYPWFGD